MFKFLDIYYNIKNTLYAIILKVWNIFEISFKEKTQIPNHLGKIPYATHSSFILIKQLFDPIICLK